MFKRLCLAALAATVLSAAPKVIAVDIDGVIHPITVDLLAHALDQAASQNAAAVIAAPEHSRRAAGCDAPDEREDRRLARAGDRLRHSQRGPRSIGRILHSRSGGRGRDGSGHEYRARRRRWRSPGRWTRPCATRSRTTLRRGCAVRWKSAGATLRWLRPRFARPARSRRRKRSTSI